MDFVGDLLIFGVSFMLSAGIVGQFTTSVPIIALFSLGCAIIMVFPVGLPSFWIAKARQLILIVGLVTLFFTLIYGAVLYGQFAGVDASEYFALSVRSIPAMGMVLGTTLTVLFFQVRQYLKLKHQQ